MAFDVFYLVPARGCTGAKQALDLGQNKASAISIPARNDITQDSGIKGFAVCIDPQATEEWTFTIGNDKESDIFLPCSKHIRCTFWLSGRLDDPDNVALMISDRSAVSVEIMDPINETEMANQVMDNISNSTRFLNCPKELFIGDYRFDIHRTPPRTERDAARFESRKRQAMTERLRDAVEEWRDTGILLGAGANGKVYQLRGMRTSIKAARKRVIALSYDQIREIKAELDMIKSLDHVRTPLNDARSCTLKLFSQEHIMRCLGSLDHRLGSSFGMDIIMPFYSTDLEHFISSQPDANIFEIVFPQIMDGVEYLHMKGIVHRDLKSGNIMLLYPKAPFRIAITDFGLSKALQGNLNTGFKGTPFYVAPEVISSSIQSVEGKDYLQYSYPIDIFSCGVIALQLLEPRKFKQILDPLALKYYAQGHQTSVLSNFYQQLREVCPRLAGKWSKLILAMLDKQPSRRPTASGVLSVLKNPTASIEQGTLEVIQEEPVQPRSTRDKTETTRTRRPQAPPVQIEPVTVPHADPQPSQVPVAFPKARPVLGVPCEIRQQPRLVPTRLVPARLNNALVQQTRRVARDPPASSVFKSEDSIKRAMMARMRQANKPPARPYKERLASLMEKQKQAVARHKAQVKPTVSTPPAAPTAEVTLPGQKDLPTFDPARPTISNSKLTGSGSRRLDAKELTSTRNHDRLYKRIHRRLKVYKTYAWATHPVEAVLEGTPRYAQVQAAKLLQKIAKGPKQRMLPGGLCRCHHRDHTVNSTFGPCTAHS